jgi:hypothetical protein
MAPDASPLGTAHQWLNRARSNLAIARQNEILAHLPAQALSMSLISCWTQGA